MFATDNFSSILTSESLAQRGPESKAWLLALARRAFIGRSRTNFYRYLASYIRRGYRVDDALTAIYAEDTDHDQRAPRSAFGLAIPHWLHRMKQEGAPLATVLEGWAPRGELMALQAFEDAGLSADTLDYLAHSIRASEATASEIKRTFFQIAKIFLAIQAGGFAMAYYVMPRLFKTIPGRIITPEMESMRGVFDFIATIGPYVCALSIIVGGAVMYFLPRLHGPARDVVDQWPIFQTYRVWQGSIWLRALAALVAAGLTIPKAMDSLAGNGTPYMNWIVDEIRENLTESLPEALRKMGKEWPSPAMITALGILLDEGKPEKSLQRYADDWLEDGRERIKESMAKLNMFGYICALVVGVWFYNGVNQMFLAFTNL